MANPKPSLAWEYRYSSHFDVWVATVPFKMIMLTVKRRQQGYLHGIPMAGEWWKAPWGITVVDVEDMDLDAAKVAVEASVLDWLESKRAKLDEVISLLEQPVQRTETAVVRL